MRKSLTNDVRFAGFPEEVKIEAGADFLRCGRGVPRALLQSGLAAQNLAANLDEVVEIFRIQRMDVQSAAKGRMAPEHAVVSGTQVPQLEIAAQLRADRSTFCTVIGVHGIAAEEDSFLARVVPISRFWESMPNSLMKYVLLAMLAIWGRVTGPALDGWEVKAGCP